MTNHLLVRRRNAMHRFQRRRSLTGPLCLTLLVGLVVPVVVRAQVPVDTNATRIAAYIEQVRATVRGAGTDACWSAAEQALIAAVDALHERATLSEAEFTALSAQYDEAKIFEIILLCGFYRTVSYLANGLALPLEEKAARFPK